MDRIEAAARGAGADRVIEKLPLGYDTVLGQWFDDGDELSVGEWQKIALARALMRSGQILVLDEPTSAMDARSEYELFRKIRRVATGRSIILITHRLSTVQMADSIYVFQAGKILERGSHEELIHQRGPYARMFETQAGYFR